MFSRSRLSIFLLVFVVTLFACPTQGAAANSSDDVLGRVILCARQFVESGRAGVGGLDIAARLLYRARRDSYNVTVLTEIENDCAQALRDYSSHRVNRAERMEHLLFGQHSIELSEPAVHRLIIEFTRPYSRIAVVTSSPGARARSTRSAGCAALQTADVGSAFRS